MRKWKYDGKEYSELKDVVSAALAAYLTGDFGQRLAFHADGVVCLMDQNSFNRDEIASRKCYGIGNMDMTFYRDGWDSEGKTDRECILACVADGDNSEEIDCITEELERQLSEKEIEVQV